VIALTPSRYFFVSMDKLQKLRSEVGENWIPEIYSETIRPMRTRALKLEIPERENNPTIHETLLGIELKVGRRRIACPDANTARYLQVFSRLGCREVAVPYDITALPAIADRLERAWSVVNDALLGYAHGVSPQAAGKFRSAAIRLMREEIRKAGAGDLMPLFNRPTKQRD
jgi:hypothetical protein